MEVEEGGGARVRANEGEGGEKGGGGREVVYVIKIDLFFT